MGGKASALRGGRLALITLALEELEVARSALERGQPARTPTAALRSPPTVHCRDRGRGADDSSQEERPRTATPLAAFHASDLTILLAMLVCTLGDLTLDVVVRLGGPIAAGGDVNSEIRVGPGGQAANVAAWAAELGAAARFVGRTGDDDAGALARARLVELGVEIVGPVGGRNGTICSLVATTGERSMASDRGAATELRAEDLQPEWLVCDHFHVSGYALMREPVRAAALRAVELARGHGARVSVDLASWSAIRDGGEQEFREAVRTAAPDVVFANEDEERLVRRSSLDAGWILKRGARGCSFDGDEREALPVERAVDSTGAGDALAAGWIVGGPDLALHAAARCVQHLGAMPIPSAA